MWIALMCMDVSSYLSWKALILWSCDIPGNQGGVLLTVSQVSPEHLISRAT